MIYIKIVLIPIFALFLPLFSYEKNRNYQHLFENKNILITGSTGFIGRAITTEILKYNPRKVIVFSRDEVKHHRLLEELANERLESILGDVRNYDSLLQATKNVDIVIHAAALKRIDMLESNVVESIYTNIIGSLNVARSCIENKVKKVLLISSDKACLPINTYGACKFIAEKIFTNSTVRNDETSFIVVRYGNVLQSTGSVIPYFCEKIRNNQPIPLTDMAMTRFFITKEQAVELILKALVHGTGGEIFVPQLNSFKIIDLIYVLQDKFKTNNEIRISGLRPGEKIHELMINSAEIPRTYKFEDMFVITPTISYRHQTNSCHKNCQRLSLDNFPEYSSANSLVSKEHLHTLLNNPLMDTFINP